MKHKYFLHAFIYILLLLSGCSEKPVIIKKMGTTCESYMWVEGSSLGDSGNCGGGLIPHNAFGMGIIPEPLPERFNLRWFNFTQQRFYEAAIYDPEMPKRAKEVIKKHSVNGKKFDKFTFYAAIENSGEVKIWLLGRGGEVSPPAEVAKFREIIGSGQGYEIFGDPERYENRTQEARERGEAPQEPLPPPPATQPPREEMSIEDFWFDMPEKKKRARYNPIR